MEYLLDTNACIGLINGRPAAVRSRFEKAVAHGASMFVSTISIYELWYGVFKSAREEFNSERLRLFLSGPIAVASFEDEDARSAGRIRASLESGGKPIGAYDILLAGQAINRQMTLVTANISEFSRVKALSWEDWGKP